MLSNFLCIQALWNFAQIVFVKNQDHLLQSGKLFNKQNNKGNIILKLSFVQKDLMVLIEIFSSIQAPVSLLVKIEPKSLQLFACRVLRQKQEVHLKSESFEHSNIINKITDSRQRRCGKMHTGTNKVFPMFVLLSHGPLISQE